MTDAVSLKTNPAVRIFSVLEINSIVGRSSTLAERLTGEFVPTGQGQALAAERLDRLRNLATSDDKDVFRELLAPLGSGVASDEELLRLLGDVTPAPRAVPPRWAVLLQEIVSAIAAAFSTDKKFRRVNLPSTHRSIPFSEIYSPAVEWARKKVESTLTEQGRWMGNEAWRGLEGWLVQRISAVCSLALQPRFLAYKAVRRAGATLARFEQNPRTSNASDTGSFFDEFVEEQGRQGMRDFFMDYPVAARLSAQVIIFWIDFIAEFLGRLDADASEISAFFLSRRPIGKIVRIKAGISDPHRGGGSVLGVHFDSGLRLVYKPRPMEIDAAFSDLLSWLNARGQLPPLHGQKILPKENHGWEGFIAHSPCRNRREAGRFFQGAGALLYLIHALRGVDFHRENMIATAEGPVLIDLEALCHPPFPETVIVENRAGQRWPFDSSVFRTGMLPIPGRRPDGGRYSNLGALAGSILQYSPATDVRWKNVNSDQMEAIMGSARLVCGTHRARLHGTLLSLRDHGKELVSGFRRMARFFQNEQRAARQWQARVAAMKGMRTRLIKRPSFLYLLMISRSLQPRFLVEGIDRSIEFQALPSRAGDEDGRQSELAALEVLDVPVFSRQPGGDPATGGNPSRIANDLASQVAAIQASARQRGPVVRRDPQPRLRTVTR